MDLTSDFSHPREMTSPMDSAAIDSETCSCDHSETRDQGHDQKRSESHEAMPQADDPVCVVGMACRLPGDIRSPSDLWDFLLQNKSAHGKIPTDRFHSAGFYSQAADRAGVMNVDGGYFINEDPRNFDNSFFGINNLEATYMDPQQRKLLEVVFECLESSGVSMNAISNSNTGVYVANFTHDYFLMQMRDPDQLHRYHGTGSGTTLLANRISHVFNLHGPSFTIDTACSSSIHCLHAAVSALKAGECDSAIVAACNLILTPEPFVAAMKTGVLSSSSECQTFDGAADGYGRAEGVDAVYLKRLSAAIRDGDDIRAIIRGTAINSNGRTPGVTLPSAEYQEAVIRKAFATAGIDFSETDYVECHGTGTAVGDPIEVEALGRCFSVKRQHPLMIGSVKSNLGHSEATSGLTSLIKVALAFKHNKIPPMRAPAYLNPKLKLDELRMKIVTEVEEWPRQFPRRASVNSFGYGGANAHAILESFESFMGLRPIEDEQTVLPDSHAVLALPISAASEKSLEMRASQVRKLVQQFPTRGLEQIASTLAFHLPPMDVRACLLVRTATDGCEETFVETVSEGAIERRRASLPFAFCFTGQGAQYAGMAKEILGDFPVFLAAIRRQDEVLKALPPPYSPQWTLEETILNPSESAHIHQPSRSQPLTTAIQVGIVEVLRSWGVQASSVIGHSSGEIAAAYAAGILSIPEAILVAYFRGFAVEKLHSEGAMMAVGIGAEEAESLISEIRLTEQVVVACINSPQSVTLSGSKENIEKLAQELGFRSKFCRLLETGGRAYHSPSMKKVGTVYQSLLDEFLKDPPKDKVTNALMFSTVESHPYGPLILDHTTDMKSYWRANLEKPVRFSTALSSILSVQDHHLIEIGPHSTLKGPIRQICAGKPLSSPYSPSLVRNEDSSECLKRLAGVLFSLGHTLDWKNVNIISPHSQSRTDVVPPYPWDYSNGLNWFESRAATELRNRRHPRHELLGSAQLTGNGIDWSWKNALIVKEVPWLSDHKVEHQIVFPAAGYLAMAIEAVSQIQELLEVAPKELAFEFQNVCLNSALVLGDGDDRKDAELHTAMSLRKISGRNISSVYFDFSISSWSSGQAVLHCSGSIRVLLSPPKMGLVNILDKVGYRTWPMDRWYQQAMEGGLAFGPHLQSITSLHSDGNRMLTDTICTTDTRPPAASDWPTPYLVHPILLDACLQAGILSAAAGNPKVLRPYLPVSIPKCLIHASALVGPTCEASIHVRSQKTGVSTLKADCTVRDPQGEPLIDFSGVRLSLYDGKLDKRVEDPLYLQRHPVMRVQWKPDIAFAHIGIKEQLGDYISNFGSLDLHDRKICCSQPSVVAAMLDLLGHKNPQMRVLDLGLPSRPESQYYLQVLNEGSAFPRFASWETVKKAEDGSIIGDFSSNSFDVLIHEDITVCPSESFPMQLISSLSTAGAVITYASDVVLACLQSAGFRTVLLRESMLLAMRISTTAIGHEKSALILTHQPSSATLELADALTKRLSKSGIANISMTPIDDLKDSDISFDTICISLLEMDHEFLATMSEGHMDLLRKVTGTTRDLFWLTGSDMLNDANPDLTLSNGLSRSLMMEQPSLNFTILDVGPIANTINATQATCDNLIRIMTCGQSIVDKEFIQSNGLLYVSRLVSDFAANTLFRQRIGLQNGLRELPLADVQLAELSIEKPGMLDTIYFQERSGQDSGPPMGFVDVKVHVTSLNAKDVYAISGRVETREGTKGLEFSGVVEAVGPDVETLSPGDRVLVCAPNSFSTVERVPYWQAHKLLPNEDMTIMATLPIAWGAALYGVRDRAHLRAGESILVHSGAGAFGTAVIRIAQKIGAVVYTTAGTEKRREFLINQMGIPPTHIFSSRNDMFVEQVKAATRGRGVDVVINSLVGDLMHASWRCVSPFGRFVEVGKRELLDTGRLEMDVFARSTTFTAFDVTEMLYHDDDYYRHVYTGLVKEVLEMYRSGQINSGPITSFDVTEIAQAYRYFSSADRVGKVVISFENPQSQIPVLPSRYTSSFAPHKSYLLVGCLGGLGRSLSSWMKARGARRFVFLGRSGCDKTEAQELVENLQRSGAQVTVVRGNVSNPVDVNKAVDACKALGPVGGVVHAAMGLHEDLFGRMTNEGWHISVRPKWLGAWNLHHALEDEDPEFVLLTSSMTGTVGVATESNYCAANAFLDAFARWRSRNGKPTVSIGLGMVSEVGYLHENPKIEALLLRRGIQPLDEDEFLQVVDLGISQVGYNGQTTWTSHMLTGMETLGVRKLLDEGFEVTHTVMDDQRSSILSAALQADRKGNCSSSMEYPIGSTRLAWMQGIPEVAAKALASETDASTLIDAINSLVGKRFSNLILLPYDKVDYNRSFAQLGVDSMIASEFRTWFWNTFRIDVPFLDLLSPEKSLKTTASFVEARLLDKS